MEQIVIMRRGKCSEWELQGSAWLHEKDLTLTVVNLHVSQVRETEIGRARRCAEVGIGNNAHPLRNSCTQHVCAPECRDPANEGFEVKGRTLHYPFPAASVTKLMLTLSQVRSKTVAEKA